MAAFSLGQWKHEVEWLVVLLSRYIVFVRFTKRVAADSSISRQTTYNRKYKHMYKLL